MSSRIFAVCATLFLAAPAQSFAQHSGEPPAQALTPTLRSAALLPNGSLLVRPLTEHRPEPLAAQAFGRGGGSSTLAKAVVLAGASLGGLWAGRQVPLPAADDDSDLSVGHLVTSPVASMVTVYAASKLLGQDHALRGALLGAAAGAGAGLLASMAASDPGIVISYAAVHGLVAALTGR